MYVGSLKIVLYDRLRSLWLICLNAENLCPSAAVVRIDEGALAE